MATFTTKMTTSKAGSFRLEDTRDLEATTLDAAKVEAAIIADEMGATLAIFFVSSFGGNLIHLADVRMTKAGQASWKVWQSTRGHVGTYKGSKWVAA